MSRVNNMKIAALAIALLTMLVPASSTAEGPDRGKELYERHCQWCHGKDGMGDGPAAEFLNPPPRDFTSGTFKWKSTPFDETFPSDGDLMKMINGSPSHNMMAGWSGMNDTSMPGWADTLGEKDARAVMGYIKSLSRFEGPERPPIDISPVKPSKEVLERGQRLFKDRCSECHGEKGRGDATKKLKDDLGFRTWPRNLTKGWTFRAGSSASDIYTRITVGVQGTQMPSFADPKSTKVMSDEDRWAAANYAASLDEPHKKPGDETTIRSLRFSGVLPQTPDDPAWEKAPYASFYMVPQIIAEDRNFKPTINSVSIKSLYNDSEIALLIEWDDPTDSVPLNPRAVEIADGVVYNDGVAVQFPGGEPGMPYFGMGGPGSVNIWFWQNESAPVSLLDAAGAKDRKERDPALSGLTAAGAYDNGRWRVVMKRKLETEDPKDARFEAGASMPIAFAAWDGSNQEKGSRHVMTGWHRIALEKGAGAGIYLWPAVVFTLVLGLEFLLLNSCRKKWKRLARKDSKHRV